MGLDDFGTSVLHAVWGDEKVDAGTEIMRETLTAATIQICHETGDEFSYRTFCADTIREFLGLPTSEEFQKLRGGDENRILRHQRNEALLKNIELEARVKRLEHEAVFRESYAKTAQVMAKLGMSAEFQRIEQILLATVNERDELRAIVQKIKSVT